MIMDIIKVSALCCTTIVLSVIAIVIISLMAKFINWLQQKMRDNKMKTYRITYVRSCTWGGTHRELATYDIKRDAVSYYVQARTYEQAVAKFFKNKGYDGDLLISKIARIEPAT